MSIQGLMPRNASIDVSPNAVPASFVASPFRVTRRGLAAVLVALAGVLAGCEEEASRQPPTVPCEPDPCGSGAVCIPVGEDHRCECEPGLEGDPAVACSTPGATCATTTCGSNSDCVDGVDGPSCACKVGFDGDPDVGCVDIDACLTNTCGDHATCTDRPAVRADEDGRTCACDPGFSGDPEVACSDADACAAAPCGPHAECADLGPPALADASGRTCACDPGFAGDAADVAAGCSDIDACATNACGANATCTDAPAPAAADVRTCACDAGFEGDAEVGCSDIDACLTNACGAHATCTDAPAPAAGDVRNCACEVGFGGDPGTGCTDVDACLANACGANATCTDAAAPAAVDVRTCACKAGSGGDPVAGCDDIDACLTNACGANATCTDSAAPAPGDARTCVCKAGFGGDPVTGCSDIDACRTNACGANATCTDAAAPAPGDARTCACKAGFGGDAMTGCGDVDACLTNACGANATCTDLRAPALGDARTCACKTGFGGDPVTGCSDVDACLTNACGANATCTDSAAPALGDARTCACKAGFKGDAVRGCSEIDACLTNACGANATCTDVAAPALGDVRTCACKPGFGGNPETGCSEIDACLANVCGANATCTDLRAPALGNARTCECQAGFEGDPNNGCVEINACATNPCGATEVCTDLPPPALGGPSDRTCACISGFEGTPATGCTAITACTIDPCGANAVCAHVAGNLVTRTCTCAVGFVGDPEVGCSDLDACTANPCSSNAVCTDLPGPALGGASGRTCACNTGYSGNAALANGCSDANACLTNACGANATCTDTPAPALADARTCACKAGFAGDPVTGCSDLDACLVNACGAHASCTDKPAPALGDAAGRTCACLTGYAGDATTGCSDIDACLTNACPAHATCSDKAAPALGDASGRDCPCDHGFHAVAAACGPVIVVTAGPLETTANGGTAELAIALDVAPTSDVTIVLTSSDTTEGLVAPRVVRFTAADWGAQRVTITGVDDHADNPAYTIELASAVSDDPVFAGVDAADVAVQNFVGPAVYVALTAASGDEPAPIESGLVTSEEGGVAQLTFVLAFPPTADVTFTFVSEDPTLGTLSTTTLVFTPENWDAPQTLTVTGNDAPGADPDPTYAIDVVVTSDDVAYDGLPVADIVVTNLDDETPGVRVTPTSGLRTTEAGGSDTFTVALASPPTADVTIALTSSDAAAGAVTASLTFTPSDWRAPKTVTVRGVDDSARTSDIVFAIRGHGTSADPGYASFDLPEVAVTNIDRGTPGITVTPTAGLVTSELGLRASFAVVLDTAPTADVTIPLRSSDVAEGTLEVSALTFTPLNWNARQTVVVSGSADPAHAPDGSRQYLVVLDPAQSSDPQYGGDATHAAVDAADVELTNRDGDSAGLVVSDAPLTTSEDGGSAEFSVVLASPPSEPVTVSVTTGSGEGVASPATLTFTPDNWDVPQTVTVTGQPDPEGEGFVDGDEPFTIVVAVIAGDPAYEALGPEVLTGTNLDLDVARLLVTALSDPMRTSESGRQARFSVALSYAPTADVQVPLSVSSPGEGTLSSASLTFTASDWNVAQEVTVTGVDDGAGAAHRDGVQGNRIVIGPTTSVDAAWVGLEAALDSDNVDNDMAPVACPDGEEGDEVAGCSEIDACLAHACGANATCTDRPAPALGDLRTCACDAGFAGDPVSGCNDIDACIVNACGTNATCSDQPAPALGNAAGRTCACNTGFAGDPLTTCSDIDACVANRCGTSATCTDKPAPSLDNAAGRSCACEAGFAGDPLTTCSDIDACVANACGTNATCSDKPAPALGDAAGRTCACDTGFAGDPLNGCSDIDACVANACGTNATCTDKPAPALGNAAGRTCACDTGFAGDPLTTCSDIDACVAHACGTNATCSDKPAPALGNAAGRTCACDAGFAGDPLNVCSDIDACVANACGTNATCSDKPAPALGNAAGRSCACNTGYAGDPVAGCADLDACLANACLGNATCADLPPPALDSTAGRTCTCASGYDYDPASGCVDRDECATPDVCAPGRTCHDDLGGHRCLCDAGTLDVNGDGSVCVAIARLSAGNGFTCSVLATGALYCWGNNGSGQLGDGTKTSRASPVQVGTGLDWSDVDAGGSHACGIRAGALWCWGSNSFAALGDGTFTNRVTPTRIGTDTTWSQVAAGGVYTCGRKGGELYCWGYNTSGVLGDGTFTARNVPTRIGADADWTDIAAGGVHACGRRGGDLYCWGQNPVGNLGNGTTTATNSPVRIGAASDWSDIALGSLHSCGRRGGQVFCWGTNGFGQLGDGTTTTRQTPVAVGVDSDWTDLTAGSDYTCGRRGTEAAGTLHCWGRNLDGQLGDGSDVNRLAPVPIGLAADWAAIDAGDSHTCGRRGGVLQCWGRGSDGQLGRTEAGPFRQPAQVGLAGDWDAVDTGQYHACGLRDGRLYCWGYNNVGQLGDGTLTTRSSPTEIGGDSDWTAVATGGEHACALRGGELYCWGSNALSQIGDGTNTNRATPTRIGTASDWLWITAGRAHSCGLRGSAGIGALYCWGNNGQNQIGVSGGPFASPVQVGSETSWTAVSASAFDHTCAIRGGALYCWGANSNGQLGVGSTNLTTSPTRVGSASDWSEVETGYEGTCGRRGGDLYCWGAGGRGQIGDDALLARSTPVAVGAGITWAAVDVGTQFVCALGGVGASGAALYCWGNNGSGQLGDGGVIDRKVPFRVGSDGWRAVAAGSGFTCGLQAASSGDGATLACWGNNDRLQLGHGDTRSPAPVDLTLACGTGLARDPANPGAGCVDADACLANPCPAHAACTDLASPATGYTCACTTGYEDNQAGGCRDIDACPGNPCLGPALCADKPGPALGSADGRTCTCPRGYDAYDPATGCANIDECDAAVDPCPIASTCTDVVGSFGCICDAGTIDVHGDGSECAIGIKAAAGQSHTCSITAAGALYCWGSGPIGDGATSRVPGAVRIGADSDWTDISAGFSHSCGVREGAGGRTLWCWGNNFYGQVGDATTIDRLVPVQVGVASDWSRIVAAGTHTCGVRGGASGTLWCWGGGAEGALGIGNTGNRPSPVQVGTAGDWSSVVGGYGFTCGLRAGQLYCWGKNNVGQLGDGTSASKNTVTRIGTASDWSSVDAHSEHACGTRGGARGTLWCWGNNDNGQLGIGTSGSNLTSPQQVGSANDWWSVATGNWHTCGIQAGALRCWGTNAFGQLGDGTESPHYLPAPVGVASDWSALAVGSYYTCGVRAGAVTCWGYNGSGELGLDRSNSVSSPARVDSSSGWSAVGAGVTHTCGVRAGELYCWGGNNYGQLGYDGNAPSAVPLRVGGAVDWSAVASSTTYSCGLRAGTLWCWGRYAHGEAGSGDDYAPLPAQVGAEAGWSDLAVGPVHTCAVRAGALYCWGTNSSGQLGDGAFADRETPTRVGIASDWSAVTVGRTHTCGRRGGALYCWGSNDYGQRGDDGQGYSPIPVQVGASGDWSAVDAGEYHTCGVRAGELYCWGQNSFSQIGDDTTQSRTTPTRIGSANDWVEVMGANRSSCGTRAGGLLYCWGSLYSSAPTSPAAASNLTGWTDVSATAYHTCAIRVGRLYCWGDNAAQQLGHLDTLVPRDPVGLPEPCPAGSVGDTLSGCSDLDACLTNACGAHATCSDKPPPALADAAGRTCTCDAGYGGDATTGCSDVDACLANACGANATCTDRPAPAGNTPSGRNCSCNHGFHDFQGACNPVIVLSTGPLATTANGGTASFILALDLAPTAEVTIVLASSDTTEGTVSPQVVHFTPADWDAKVITVTGVDDHDDNPVYTITTAPAASDDPLFDAVDAADIDAQNAIGPAIYVAPVEAGGAPEAVVTSEAGGTAQLTYVLAFPPTADVVFTLVSTDPTLGTVSTTTLVFTPENWNAPQTVTVTGHDVPGADPDPTYQIVVTVASADPAYEGLPVDAVAITNIDDESPGVRVTPTSGLRTSERGASDTFSVVLTGRPAADVTIDLTSSDPLAGAATPSLVFTPDNWDAPQIVSVSGVDDPSRSADVAYVIHGDGHSSDPGYASFTLPDVAVTNVDRGTPGITVTPIAGLVTSESGQRASFTVVLDTMPSAAVVIPVRSSNTAEGTLAVSALTFTPLDWNARQTVVVTGAPDPLGAEDGSTAYRIVLDPVVSADPDYGGDSRHPTLDAADVDVINRDADSPGLVVSGGGAPLTTTEDGGAATFSVALASPPTSNVTVTVASGSGEGVVYPTTLTFTPDNWDIPQTVTVTGQADPEGPAFVDGDAPFSIVVSVTAGDPDYLAVGPTIVEATNLDLDRPRLVVTPLSAPMRTSEDGRQIYFSVALSLAPLSDVHVPISAAAPGEGSVSSALLTFTTTNWETPQLVTITGVDDAGVADGVRPNPIALGPTTSSDPAWVGLEATVASDNEDDDGAGFSCPDGFQGDEVSGCSDIDACRVFGCGVHASCSDLPAPAPGNAAGRTCACDAGYGGDPLTLCSDIDACLANGCGNNGVCSDLPPPASGNATGRSCACAPGFATDPITPANGCVDIDACGTTPCGANTTCDDAPAPALGGVSGRTCDCKTGFAGDPESGCVDIDACPANACGINAVCSDKPAPALGDAAGRTCACATGFGGDPLTTCSNLDACLANACAAHASCVDSPPPALGDASGRTCPCHTGYEGDGTAGCVDSDACAHTPCAGDATCSDLSAPALADASGRTCSCPAGFLYDAVLGCVDVDECAQPASLCAGGASCENLMGAYRCACAPGTIDVRGDGSECATLATITAGGSHTCALATSGALYCWGDNGNGQLGDGTTTARPSPVQVGSASDWVDVAAGQEHTCGRRALAGGNPGSTLYCWGDNRYRQLGDGTTTTRKNPIRVGIDTDWSAVSLGQFHSCGSRSGALYCWGDNGVGALGDGTTTSRATPTRIGVHDDWAQLAAGSLHTCGLRGEAGARALYCWGLASDGQLGNGITTTLATSPIQVGSDLDWSQVSAGRVHTCGRSDGALYCWGDNTRGQLGDGSVDARPTPTPIGSATDWSDIAVADTHTCGRRADALYCWGNNASAQLGNDASGDLSSPTQVGNDTGWTQVRVGDAHTCATRDGVVRCWGSFERGSIGDGQAQLPSPVSGAWDQVSAGSGHTCALHSGALSCWGDAVGTSPTTIDGSDWSDVSTGTTRSCGIRAGALYCWSHGELPAQVGAASDWTGVSVGTLACGLAGGALYCWSDAAPTPTRVGGDSDWTATQAAVSHACGLRAGALYCWGNNAAGQLGDGTLTTRSSPTRVGAASDWIGIALGTAHTCGVRNNGVLYCWGDNARGQLGDGTTLRHATPAAVGSATDWAGVTAGADHTCARRTRIAGAAGDGTLYCWGKNLQAQIGDGSLTDRLRPVQVGTTSDWTRVDGGASHTCGLRGSMLACWGDNGAGQLGLAIPGALHLVAFPPGCAPGYRPDLVAGCVDVDACVTNTCGPNATCSDKLAPALGDAAGRTCTCTTGFGGDGTNTVVGCTDLDACAANPCGENALCTDLPAPALATAAGRTCACQPGFAGDALTGCSDIDACVTNTCGANATCTDLPAPALGNAAGRTCGCHVGYGGNPVTGCSDLDACAANPCGVHASCTDKPAPALAGPADRTCACATGYGGNAVLGCGDIDACLAHPCVDVACSDKPAPALDDTAGRTCGTCPTGFTHDEVLGCVDNDECTTGNFQCASGALCENIAGGYRCACEPGTLDLNADGSACSRIVKIASGTAHTCAIAQTGGLYCWGSSGSGQLGEGAGNVDRANPVQAGTATDWVDIAVGGDTTCGRRGSAAAGTLWCWGRNQFGQVGDGSTAVRYDPVQVGAATTWSEVDVGHNHACGRLGGALYCWGANNAGQLGDGTTAPRNTPVPIASGFTDWTDVSAGYEHSCARRGTGQTQTLYCWGSNDYGKLGDGTTTQRLTPVPIGGATDWSDIGTGTSHTCGRRGPVGASAIYCWGNNFVGQLGIGTTVDQASPTRVGVASDWTDLTMGDNHACARRGTVAAGALYCWGYNSNGELGLGHLTSQSAPVQVGVAADWASVAGGNGFTCGLRGFIGTGGAVACWGINTFGQVGTGIPARRPSPVAIGTATNWSGISAGERASCGIRSSGAGQGELYCWGRNESNQLGDGSDLPRSTPTRIGVASDWTQVAIGPNHACGLRGPPGAATLYCWGINYAGQLGDASTTNRSEPVQVGSASDWSQVSVGDIHTCGRRGGALYCWGRADYGRLGDGWILSQRTSPFQVGTATDWSAVDAGSSHTCGLRGPLGSATLYCFGENEQGQLGNGSTTLATTPIQIGSDADWSEIDLGLWASCGLRANGQSHCWGYTEAASVPTRVGSDTWSHLARGRLHTCALRGGALYCRGNNQYGQLGNGGTQSGSSFVRVGTASDWTSVAAGSGHTCGLRGGALFCWGNDEAQQLGLGDAWSPRSAVFLPGCPAGQRRDPQNPAAGCVEMNACVSNPCAANATCTDKPAPALGNADGRTCACNTGFAGNATTFCGDINACLTNACGTNASCMDKPAPALGDAAGRTCACLVGFAGNPLTSCGDIDACSANPCGSNASCTDRPAPAGADPAGRTCACNAGYDGDAAAGCGQTNACAVTPCGTNAACVDLPPPATGDASGRTCACPAGYEGNPSVACTDINACHFYGCNYNSTCYDKPPPALGGATGRVCLCNPDYEGDPESNLGCTQIDHCVGVTCTLPNDCYYFASACNPRTGLCGDLQLQPTGTDCSDGNHCTLRDYCQLGTCVAGYPVGCSDGNDCTEDSCDPSVGCRYVDAREGEWCGSGYRPCYADFRCESGACVGTTSVCDDDNPCTLDTCVGNGYCESSPQLNGALCSDGDACNGMETCSDGVCMAGTADACSYEVGVEISGLVGDGLVLRNNAETMPIGGNGTRVFARDLPNGANYTVTIEHQPDDPTQRCHVPAGVGAIAGEGVFGIEVVCGPCGNGVRDGSDPVTMLTFEWVAKTSVTFGPVPLTFKINGSTAAELNGNPSSSSCEQSPVKVSVTTPQVLALVSEGENVFSVSYPESIAWAVVTVHRTRARPVEVVVFDWLNPGDAKVRRGALDCNEFLSGVSSFGIGRVTLTEECDDGNLLNGDGCSMRCLNELCDPTRDSDGDRLDDCTENNSGVYVRSDRTGTDPDVADTDGDGIDDGDEVLGTRNGLYLGGYGASPLRKDIFVEMDWLQDETGCAQHSHQPTPYLANLAIEMFARAPVTNPDGSTGISLHLDYGQGNIANQRYDGGNLAGTATSLAPNPNSLLAYKEANFAANRRGIFHYALFAHSLNGAGGVAEFGGDDILIGNGSAHCSNVTEQYRAKLYASTFVHELGHNLGLRHGGGDECEGKPNYPSLMNQRYIYGGVDTGCDTLADGVMDYSRGARLPLDEWHLDEYEGICGSAPIDWNGINGFEADVSWDVNPDQFGYWDCNGDKSLLEDHDDWSNLAFDRVVNGQGDAPQWQEAIVCP